MTQFCESFALDFTENRAYCRPVIAPAGAAHPKLRGMQVNYDDIFARAIDRLHEEGRYRVFIDILRNKGAFPNARCFAGHNGPKPITVWCSNDYLAMGQHPKVIAAMEEALHDVGAGSGGTRNIGGNTHYHIDLEAELADLHSKEGALLFTSGYISNEATLGTLGKLLPNCIIYSERRHRHAMDRGRKPLFDGRRRRPDPRNLRSCRQI